MMKFTIKTLLVIGVLLLSSCIHNSTGNSVPALIPDTDAEMKIELKKAVAQLLNQETVSIAEDAFQNRSYITLERVARQDSRGNRIQGRELDMPDKIQLFLINGECILKRESNSSIVKLENMKCVPEN